MRRLALLLALLLMPAASAAQAGRSCGLRPIAPDAVTTRDATQVVIRGLFEVVCDDGATVRANSGVMQEATRVVTLTGDVRFRDPTRTLTSERAVYDANRQVLHATGNVVFTDVAEGTQLRGPELEYFRATETRPVALVNATGRPRLTLTRLPQRDSAAAAPAPADTSGAPTTIDADRLSIRGADDLTAIGNVLIQDDEMRAVADRAERRGAAETLELRGKAEIHSREYSLSGGTIFATTPEGSIRDVNATGDARLLGPDLNVRAPRLDLTFENDLLQRSVARSDTVAAPGVQPLATSPAFRLQADSIDATLPGQRLEMVVAIGNARGESVDTTQAAPADSGGVAERFTSGDSVSTMGAERLIENDWITGDTITGYFGARPDSAGADTTIVMERLVALGAGRALYRMEPEADSVPGARVPVNFISAQRIELQFEEGQVKVADVSGLRRGQYLDPLPAQADTAAADSVPAGAPPTGAPGTPSTGGPPNPEVRDAPRGVPRREETP